VKKKLMYLENLTEEKSWMDIHIKVVERYPHKLVFDVQHMPPKWCISLLSAIRLAVPTLKIDLPTIYPAHTNTVMDYKQWANRLGHIALESRHIDEFNYVMECNCEAGGKCCESMIELTVTNNSTTDEMPLYTDDLVNGDNRVLPVHRTFSLVAIYNMPDGYIGVETDQPHTFSDGDLVTVLGSLCSPALPQYLRATQCEPNTIVLERLFPDQPPLQIEETVSYQMQAQMVGSITNRQLLYYLGLRESVSLKAIVRKGTGRQHIKWSPVVGGTGYRPLMRDLQVRSELLTTTQRQGMLDVCPKRVFDIEDSHLVAARPDDCDACRQCEYYAVAQNQPESVTLPQRKLAEWHRFTVETNGSLDAEDVVRRALKIVQQRLLYKADSAGAQLMYPDLK
jgi:hypothetical protein